MTNAELYETTIKDFYIKEEPCKSGNLSIDYSTIYHDYNYSVHLDRTLDYSFDNVILDPNLVYKKIESATFKDQYNKLLKQDEMLKEMIFNLKANIDDTFHSNTINIDKREDKLNKIISDLNIHGNIIFKDTHVYERYYINLKSTKLYNDLYDFYLNHGTGYYKNTTVEPVIWSNTINSYIITMSEIHDVYGDNSHQEITISITHTTNQDTVFTCTLSNSELFPSLDTMNYNIKYLLLPIIQIFHHIELLKSDPHERAKWYIILHKLIGIYKKFIKHEFHTY